MRDLCYTIGSKPDPFRDNNPKRMWVGGWLKSAFEITKIKKNLVLHGVHEMWTNSILYIPLFLAVPLNVWLMKKTCCLVTFENPPIPGCAWSGSLFNFY